MSSIFDSGIRPIVDEHLLKLASERRDYGNYWSASSAGYCMRKNIFERLGVPHVDKESDARLQRVFTSGHIFHEWIQKLTKDAGISVAQEVELIDEELMVKGHFDDLVLIKYQDISGKDIPTQEQSLILYDYKTQNSRAFSYKRPNMSHYHKMQLGTYMYMIRNAVTKDLGKKYYEHYMVHGNLEEARILKISKDDLRMNEEQLLWTPELEKDVVQYWSTLNGYWESKKLPKCTCDKYEGGFMASERFNPFFYDGEPCSLKWYERWKNDIQ